MKTNITIDPTLTEPSHKTQAQNKQERKSDQAMALLYAYMCILVAVQTDNETASVQQKQLEINAVEQNSLINKQNAFPLAQLTHDQLYKLVKKTYICPVTPFSGNTLNPKHITKWVWEKKGDMGEVIAKVQLQDQEVQEVISVIEGKISVLRQNAQVGSTQFNSLVDTAEQSIQQGGGLMQMLVSLSNQISRF